MVKHQEGPVCRPAWMGSHCFTLKSFTIYIASAVVLVGCLATAAGQGPSTLGSNLTSLVAHATAFSRLHSLSDSDSVTGSTLADNASHEAQCNRYGDLCRPGIMLPVWLPTGSGISTGDKVARAIVYFIGLCYLFLGVSIISDRFMSAIEVITSKEREVIIRKHTGEEIKVKVRIWNETVSNLTLMALGSSAPEILLSIIEVIGNNFNAGDLGPGTIVGSAAYNLFIIIALCVYVIPDGMTKRIKHLRVFFITASWSIFAYIWLYIIIAVWTPGEVSVWEGGLTFFFFPLTVLTAYIADKRLLPHKLIAKRYRAPGKSHRGVIVQTEGKTDVELQEQGKLSANGEALLQEANGHDVLSTGGGDQVGLLEAHRQEYVEVLRELHRKHPAVAMPRLEEMAQYEIMNRGPKSRAFYRILAIRNLTGGGNLIRQRLERQHRKAHEEQEALARSADAAVNESAKIFFDPPNYTVMENIGELEVKVRREGKNLHVPMSVDFTTEDATACAGSDYVSTKGTLVFAPGETLKSFNISIIDDNVFEEDEHFFVVLSDPRTVLPSPGSATDRTPTVVLGDASLATVVILDDDHPGVFHFDKDDYETTESAGVVHVKVNRSSGARGRVALPYKLISGTAVAGRDFEATGEQVVFANDEYESMIAVNIIDSEAYQKDAVFYIELGEPRIVAPANLESPSSRSLARSVTSAPSQEAPDVGRPKLGQCTRVRVHIKESTEFKSTVDKLVRKSSSLNLVGTSSWKEQFLEAITVSAACAPSEDGDDEDGSSSDGDEKSEAKLPSCGDYVSHYLSIFWKILFACVPPTEYLGGWLCFVVSIIVIGFLTAIIGDLANHFGCTIGLKDAVTAISFVALGTSLPDTFASKVAAINDEFADSSIGNVTGSNAVNVFLGIGIAWTIAAIKHAVSGTVFTVKAGSLAFAVTLFCVFAFFCITVMLVRRLPFVGGELGGPRRFKVATSAFMVLLWILYILLSALESYCYIPGF